MRSMTMTALAAIAGLCAALSAQTQEQLEERRAAKMALPVFKKAAWTFDYDKARADAKKSGKLIFAYFTRSYAH
ncbi:MAG: hypothetical protein Fur0037_05120 [Planctomycetota bacterium]